MRRIAVISVLTSIVFTGAAFAQMAAQGAPDQGQDGSFSQARRLLERNATFERIHNGPAVIRTAALVIVVHALARFFPNTHLGQLYADHNDTEIRNLTPRFEACLEQHWGLGTAERSKTYENVVVECANEIEHGG